MKQKNMNKIKKKNYMYNKILYGSILEEFILFKILILFKIYIKLI
jgi:hypothetical protein